jgi:hypothetical protein
MACGTCGGNHVGTCPGVSCRCRGCGRQYVAGNGWYNHFYCGPGCCAVRRAELNPVVEEDDYYG